MTPPRPESSACPGRPWRTPGRFCWPWSASTSGICGVPLTLRRLGEAVHSPRLPDKGKWVQYDLSVPASSYVADDLALLMRTDTE